MTLDNIKYNLIKQLNTPLIAAAVIFCVSIGLLWTAWNSVQSIWFSPVNTTSEHYMPPQRINVGQLPTDHLMGASASTLGDLPLASLGVTLIGIFAGNQNNSIALIALSGGQSKIYRVGDNLAPNVSIEKILPYSVIVKHNGRLEKLTMPIQPLQFSEQLPASGLWG